MKEIDIERLGLADYIASRRTAILETWRNAVKRDPVGGTGDSLPRVQLFDHIPALLSTFERELRLTPASAAPPLRDAAQESAAAHGLQRWRQGYDLREVIHELGKLKECVVAELDGYAAAKPQVSHAAIAMGRKVWAGLCSTGIEESVGQYFQLHQQEAAGHVKDLESALSDIRELEKERADLWRQAAHDLRGNLGVVANATVGLAHGSVREGARDEFINILMRNVTNLHHLLDDVTSLARLEAGSEQRRIHPMIDVALIFQQLCEGIRPLAQQHRLFLRCEGPPGFAADGDPVKIRRIAQNLILNAVKYTRDGGITVTWGDCGADDGKRWELRVVDTGPGIHSASAEPLGQALRGEQTTKQDPSPAPIREEAGEGIGLSIVKRLCELLDAAIELESKKDVGTCFRVLFPRKYSS